MPRYRVKVSEVIHHAVVYVVEAADARQAVVKAVMGETVEETFVKNHGVMDRHVESTPVVIESSEEADQAG